MIAPVAFCEQSSRGGQHQLGCDGHAEQLAEVTNAAVLAE
jgi:hypothetical protein